MACLFYKHIKNCMRNTRLEKYLQRRKKEKAHAVAKDETPKQTGRRSGTKRNDPKKNKDIIMDMPEVKDIPGQENIIPPKMREMIDTTASSDDEEGRGLLDDLNRESSDDIITDAGNNVTNREKKSLRRSDRPESGEAKDRKKLALGGEGSERLNEGGSYDDMGKDLDVPGTELDNKDEDIGAEDEENNSYSGRD